VSANLKTALRWLGVALSFLGVGYVIWRFSSTGAVDRLLQGGLPTTLLIHVGFASLLYTVGCTFLALGWWWLLCAFLRESPRLMPIAGAYATSQFAKYLPGNVAHYLARHAMLRRLELPHGGLVAAAGLEAGCLITAALIWAVPAAGNAFGRILHVPAGWLVLVLAGGGLAALGLLRLAARHTRVRQWVALERPRFLLCALMAHIGFFGVMALSLGVVAAAMPDMHVRVWHLTGAVTTSWLAGFLVVGSPAGLGVREAVFAELLRGVAPENTILLLAAAFRVVTFLGDLGFFAAGLVVFARLRHRPGTPSRP
jgi:hypothetical protein